MPPAMAPGTSGLLQPRLGCSMKPATSRPRPVAQRNAPGRSTRTSFRRSARWRPSRVEIMTVASAIGTLMRKITRQLEMLMSQPPTSGPMTNEIPLHAVHVPIAAPRSLPENVDVIIASEAGVSSAPAMPWRPRNTMSDVESGATAHSTDTRPKLATPSVNIRSSPKMSPSEPPTRMSEPSVSRYASTIHCWAASPPPRSLSIAWRATLTTEPSMKAIDDPRTLAMSVHLLTRSIWAI